MWLLKLKALMEFISKNGKYIALAAVFLFGYMAGSARMQVDFLTYKNKVEKEAAAQQQAIADLKARSGEATVKVVERYVDRWKTVTVKGETIIKEVPKYVTAEDDSRCTVPDSFRVLWETANRTGVPEPASITDGTPHLSILEGIDLEPIKLSDIARAKAEESLICNQNYEKVLGLQDWIRTQQCVINKECGIKPGP